MNNKQNNRMAVFVMIMLVITMSAFALIRAPFYAASPTLVQTGTGCTSNSAWSSNNFTIAYSVAPTVICQQIGVTNSPTNQIGLITTTYFIVTNYAVNVSNIWVAIGTP